MTTVENRKTSIPKPEGDGELNYFDLLKTCTNTLVGNAGIKMDEMRTRLNIAKKIEDNNAPLAEFNEDEIKLIKKLVGETGWMKPHEDLYEFLKYIKEATPSNA